MEGNCKGQNALNACVPPSFVSAVESQNPKRQFRELKGLLDSMGLGQCLLSSRTTSIIFFIN